MSIGECLYLSSHAQTTLTLHAAAAAREAHLASARYTPPLPSGAFARLWGDAMMILPSGVKHGSCPCSAANNCSSWHASVTKLSVLTISTSQQRLPSVLTISAYHQRLPSICTISAHLLKKEKLGRVQAEVLVLGEMLLGGCICGRTGHDVPPDWVPA